MGFQEKMWILEEPMEEEIKSIARDNNVSELMAKILINRGMTQKNDIEGFLNPSLNMIDDPFVKRYGFSS